MGGAFLFAYHFPNTTHLPGRHRLASCREAARQVQQIWEEALRTQEETILPLFMDLLRSHALAADAEIVSPLFESSTVRQIWQYLLRESADKQFFYSEKMTRGILRHRLFLVMMTDADSVNTI